MTTYPVRTRRWTRAEYDRLIELGILHEDEHVELIGGEMVVHEPQGSSHYTAARLVARALEMAFGPGWDVRQQGPIALDDESEPEPDVAVVPGRIRDYRDAHPARPALAVEVSDSTLRFDRVRKSSLYARAGLADYWIVNVVNRVLEVYRDPTPDAAAPFGWRYGSAETLGPEATVSPLAAPAARVRVADLLP
jgi:Uma2 family endonuclease